MSELERLQDTMMRYLLQPDADNEADCLQWVDDQHGLAAPQRLHIYANAYKARLREVIDTDHEMLGLYLGDELFEQMVSGYLAAYQSPYTSLRQYCDRLPEFLRQDSFFSQYPILSDLAGFERRLFDAFDAAESDRVPVNALEGIAANHWPILKVRFHPSVQLCQFQSNAVESWQALKHNQEPPAPRLGESRYWLLWRNQERVTEFSSLQYWQYRLMAGFLNGDDLSQQCELLLDTFDENETPGQVFAALQAWLEMGIISHFS
ncbi:MAG: DUF2063 domain-containing protein [Oceanospirillaceae bacterium]|nr:DUF2063 domain-containing protein [Oceanospirillaceae bacterium]